MPEESEDKLWKLVEELRAENNALIEIILKKSHFLLQEESSKIEIPQQMKQLGKIPWYRMKSVLESQHVKKPSLQELTGIPEKGDKDASEVGQTI